MIIRTTPLSAPSLTGSAAPDRPDHASALDHPTGLREMTTSMDRGHFIRPAVALAGLLLAAVIAWPAGIARAQAMDEGGRLAPAPAAARTGEPLTRPVSAFAGARPGPASLLEGIAGGGALDLLGPSAADQVLATCPCSILPSSLVPVIASNVDGNPVELGMKFTSSIDGNVTGVRFYKGTSNTGPHVGNLWSSTGNLLGTVAFSGETGSGWQTATFPAPIAISAGAVYVISYHTTTAYAITTFGFVNGITNGWLHALANGENGGNGVFTYGAASAFPTSSFQASNYFVDVVFSPTGADATPPTVTATSPLAGAAGATLRPAVVASFDEPLDPANLTTSSFTLTGPGNTPVAATVTWNSLGNAATIRPNANLAYSTTYTATLRGGGAAPHVTDAAGNPLAADVAWTFTTQPVPTQGTGGPILVVSDTTNAFSLYPVEILRAEGLNGFTATDVSRLTPALLGGYDVVVLGQMSLNATQVTTLTNWVTNGGTLVAMRPDKLLAPLLGLTDANATLANQYLAVNTSTGPGVGITGETMQFHGTADLYTLSGASAIAMLWSSATTATPYPAVTQRTVGSNGGLAMAFTYDLARSVVYTRQGNPKWAGQNRDGQSGPRRSDDFFYGAAVSDPQPDWVDFGKIAIPQADEQQRLLANAILLGNLHRKPLPRFWYLPRGLKAAVVMSGDDHAMGGTVNRFYQYIAASPSNTAAAVANWNAVRGSSYLFNNGPTSSAQAAAFTALGFELGLHLDTGCADWTPSALETMFTSQLATFASQLPGAGTPVTHRTHCIAMSDWTSMQSAETRHGIRLDTNYYYWPGAWVQDRPGLFTGSGLPMRFADTTGTLIDCYQLTTQMPDESGETFPAFVDTLLARALGDRGYYGVFCANMHTDYAASAGSDAILASCEALQVPVISAQQLLQWLDGRNTSTFGAMTWSGGVLTFPVQAGVGANNLDAMLPLDSPAGRLVSVTLDGAPVAYSVQTVKGIDYVVFPVGTGTVAATYTVDLSPPVITNVSAAPHGDGTATITWTTDELADSRVDYGTSAGALSEFVSAGAPVTSHTLSLAGLATGATYYYRVTSMNLSDLSATSPALPGAPLTFTTPATDCPVDASAGDFALGTPDTNVAITSMADGEVILAPAATTDFSGSALPPEWQAAAWGPGSTISVAAGELTLNNARAATTASFGPGRSLEFVATFGAEHFQHVGFATNSDFDAPWAIFSTSLTGSAVYARTDDGTSIEISNLLLGSPHRYRIDWNFYDVTFWVDGVQVAQSTHRITSNMVAVASDVDPAATSLDVDWVRVTPYAVSGTFTSRVFGGATPSTWGAMTWTADTTGGTTVAMSVRHGMTPVPDTTWSAFAPVGASGTSLGVASRYVQYRAALATPDSSRTPVLQDVAIACVACSDTAPPAIANLAVSRLGTGGSGDRLPLQVVFTKPGSATAVEVWRAPFGSYPRYDKAGGSTPATPSYPPPAPWTLTSLTASGQTDLPPTRDVWHYVVFTFNHCGLVSAASNRPAGVPDYLLGDVSDGVTPCTGDDTIDMLDFSLLGAHYGTTLTGSEAWTCLDVGPTLTGMANTRPVVDGALDFEDLMIMALNLATPGSNSPPPLALAAWNAPARAAAFGTASGRDALALVAPAHVEAGQTFTATLRLEGSGELHGLSARLAWNASVATPLRVEADSLASAYGALVLSPAPGRADVAVPGANATGLAGSGPLVRVTFRALAAGDPAVALAGARGRDGSNAPVALDGQAVGVADAPVATAFAPVAPNPMVTSATLAFSLASAGPVDLSVYSVEGRRVASLVHEMRAAGRHHVVWDGRGTTGQRLPQGMYYAQLVTPQGRFTRTLIVLR